MLTFTADSAQFAAARRGILEDMDERLRPLVEEALESGNFVPVTDEVLAIFYQVAREEDPDFPLLDTSDPHPLALNLLRQVMSALAETTETASGTRARDTQRDTITAWLSTAAVNAGTEAAVTLSNDGSAGVEWVSMHDGSVRESHRDVDGEIRPLGEPFTVAGVEMNFPAEPVGPPSVWINCRCVLRPVLLDTATITAAVDPDDPDLDAVIVAVPANDDPVATMGPEEKHATLIYMARPNDEQVQQLGTLLSTYAAKLSEEIVSPVTGRDTLGKDEANVLMLSEDPLTDVRNGLLEDSLITGLMGQVEQYPSYTPHVTLGYPEDDWDPEAVTVPEMVTFDRLALWIGRDRWEFSLGERSEANHFAVEETAQEEDEDDLPNDYDPTELEPQPWYGVLAPEGVDSGDKRKFLENALNWRDLPIPLAWIPADWGRHDGAVVVGRIERIWRDAGLIKAEGFLDDNEHGQEVLRLLAERTLRGVSVDLDDLTLAEGEDGGMEFPSARISSATLCRIPAFSEAFISLGTWEEADAGLEPRQEDPEPVVAAISTKDWDGSASRFTDAEWRRSCILDRGESHDSVKERYGLPIREPNGDLNRNGVHAAAGRINQVSASDEAIAKAKGRLRSAYRELDEEPPEVVTAGATGDWVYGRGAFMDEGGNIHDGWAELVQLNADTAVFKRGSGWVTHPKETSRLHRYWTKGPGAAKIRWGQPNDFYRCRRQLAKYINPIYLNRTCAEWHHDATGTWPGQHHSGGSTVMASIASAEDESLMASAAEMGAPPTSDIPKAWFDDPNLSGPTPMTVTDDGRIFGHIATWGVCHLGIGNKCVMAPKSASGYEWFHLGEFVTDEGPLSVGKITLGGGHAEGKLGIVPAIEHYDSTSSVAAYARAGEDEHGIWFSGVLNDLSAKAIRELRGAVLSGDWRTAPSGNYELVAALAVNVPGFPVPRPTLVASAGRVRSLTAANIVERNDSVDIDHLTDAVVAQLARRERAQQVKRSVQKFAAEERERRITEALSTLTN